MLQSSRLLPANQSSGRTTQVHKSRRQAPTIFTRLPHEIPYTSSLTHQHTITTIMLLDPSCVYPLEPHRNGAQLSQTVEFGRPKEPEAPAETTHDEHNKRQAQHQTRAPRLCKLHAERNKSTQASNKLAAVANCNWGPNMAAFPLLLLLQLSVTCISASWSHMNSRQQFELAQHRSLTPAAAAAEQARAMAQLDWFRRNSTPMSLSHPHQPTHTQTHTSTQAHSQRQTGPNTSPMANPQAYWYGHSLGDELGSAGSKLVSYHARPGVLATGSDASADVQSTSTKTDDDLEQLERQRQQSALLLASLISRQNGAARSLALADSESQQSHPKSISVLQPRGADSSATSNEASPNRDASQPSGSGGEPDKSPSDSISSGSNSNSNPNDKSIEPRQRRRIFNRILKKAEWNHLFMEVTKVCVRYFVDLGLKELIGKQSGSDATTSRKKLDAQSEFADFAKEFLKVAILNIRDQIISPKPDS